MADAYPFSQSTPNEEELERAWTLSAEDLEQVHRCRGDSNRHRFAVQLCALRTLGRFVDDVAVVPVRIRGTKDYPRSSAPLPCVPGLPFIGYPASDN